MSAPTTFREPETGLKQLLVFGTGIVAVIGAILMWLLAALFILWLLFKFYLMITDVGGIKVEETPPTVVDMLPPPPPPPPPPPEPDTKPPEPVDKPDPVPNPQPAPADKPAPAPMQINGPAQAGADSYGMSSGTGNGAGAPGSQGTCVTANCGGTAAAPAGFDRFWGRNVANALEAHIEASRKVNIDSFAGDFEIWVNASGVLTQARMVRSTGDGKLDQTILAILNTASGLRAPPASIRMPQRIKVGRKRF